jgi:hypothetical protein
MALNTSSTDTSPPPTPQASKKPPPPPDVKNQPAVSLQPTGGPGQSDGTPTANPASPLTPPAVPKYTGGGGKTVVNTAALQAFGDNIAQLVQPITAAANLVTNAAPITPGGFFAATVLTNLMSGDPSTDAADAASAHMPGASAAGGPQAILPTYHTVLSSLSKGLTDLQAAVKQMGSTYKTADDLSKASVTDLQTSLGGVQNDFTAMMQANGGGTPPSSLAAPPPTSTTPPPSTTGAGGSGSSGTS